MPAKADIIQILHGHEAARMRFTFPSGSSSITISQHAFQRVARAIHHDHIRVNVVTTLPVGVAAQYDTVDDRLDTKATIGRADQGLMLHECTHAFFDITRSPVNALDDEAAAYVVDALYYRMTGLTRPRWSATPHSNAGLVADALLQDYQRGSVAVPAVNATAWTNLRNAIRAVPVYAVGPAGTGGNYVNDGLLRR
jgi:hypothetical protein